MHLSGRYIGASGTIQGRRRKARRRRPAGTARGAPRSARRIDRPLFETAAPAIVFCRRDRAMVDVLLDFGADINARSQFWGRTVGVLDDNTPRDARVPHSARGGPGNRRIRRRREAQGRGQSSDAARDDAGTAPRRSTGRCSSFGAQAIVAAKDDRAMVETLLEFGANINVRSDWWAGGFGVLDDTDPEQAAWLIERGAIVDIHAAAGLGMIDKVREWLASDPSLVHAPGGDGQRPLHFASTTEIIDLLLEHGADINARDIDHQSTAAQYKVRDTELCRHLIARGADVDIFMAAALGDRTLVERVLDDDPGASRRASDEPGYAPVPPGHIYQWKLTGGPSVLLVAAKDGGREIYDLLFSRSPVKEQFLAACRAGRRSERVKALAANPDLLTELAADDQRADRRRLRFRTISGRSS